MQHDDNTSPLRGGKYLLFMTATIYAASIVDRSILPILAQPIKQDLAINDTKIGILGGIAFALLYSVLAIPVARLAERRNRMTIMAVAILIWSIATVSCGMAANFVQLMFARVGVGVGEAACSPSSHSLIADSFPPKSRAFAMSLYSLAVPIGTLIGAVLGAWAESRYGWRMAFIIAGAPGVVLAALAKFTVREPVRGRFDPPSSGEAPTYREVLRHLLARKSFRHLAIAMALSSLAASGIGPFIPSLILRGPFYMSLTQIAAAFGGTTMLAMLVGIIAGGSLSSWLASQDQRRNMLIPAIGSLLAVPLYFCAFLMTSIPLMMVLWGLGTIGCFVYMGPAYATVQNMVSARMRASAIATLLLLTSVIGVGFGPVLIGWLSDLGATMVYHGKFMIDCRAGTSLAAACRAASFLGLRNALLATSLLNLWAGAHFLLAMRTIREDLPAGN